jgi:hypothetical protein
MEERVKTKTECLEYAALCERMAADADHEAGRIALLATAAHWRSLANHAPDGKVRAARRRRQTDGTIARPEPSQSGTPCDRATLNGADEAAAPRRSSMSKKPPVPPANRTPKGTGSDPKGKRPDIKPAKAPQNLREQGDAGNVEQNTRNQGYQQDR